MRQLSEYMKLQRTLWKEFAFPSVIAGGAPRDLDQGKPVKDVDLFIYAGGRRDTEVSHILNYLVETTGKTFKDISTVTRGGYQSEMAFRRGILDCVVEFPTEPYPLQVIFYSPGTQHQGTVMEANGGILEGYGKYVIDGFDLDICKIFLRPDGTAFRSDPYILAHAGRQITVPWQHHSNRTRQTIDHYRERVERLSQKYPDYGVRWEANPDVRTPFTRELVGWESLFPSQPQPSQLRSPEDAEDFYTREVERLYREFRDRPISSRSSPSVQRANTTQESQLDGQNTSWVVVDDPLAVSTRRVEGSFNVRAIGGETRHVGIATQQMPGFNELLSLPDLPDVDDEIPY